MASWRRICCALDFSEASREALREAAWIANRVDASLVLVHVVDLVAVAPPDAIVAAELGAAARAEAVRLLEGARDEAAALAPGRVSVELLTGDPAWEVAKFAEERSIDLLVVGTHGRSGWRRLALGSVAERILRMAPCPVLAVRMRAAPEAH